MACNAIRGRGMACLEHESSRMECLGALPEPVSRVWVFALVEMSSKARLCLPIWGRGCGRSTLKSRVFLIPSWRACWSVEDLVGGCPRLPLPPGVVSG